MHKISGPGKTLSTPVMRFEVKDPDDAPVVSAQIYFLLPRAVMQQPPEPQIEVEKLLADSDQEDRQEDF